LSGLFPDFLIAERVHHKVHPAQNDIL
jgi:hypothetical protein